MERMDDLPWKPGRDPNAPLTAYDLAMERKAQRLWEKEVARESRREMAADRRQSPAKRKSATRKRTTVKKTTTSASRPKKSLPAYRLPGEQPRDSLGRFARKTGAVLWAGTKAAGRAVVSTAKGIKKAHKTVKRVNAAARKRARLEDRERRLRIAERERKLGIGKKVRRRKRV